MTCYRLLIFIFLLLLLLKPCTPTLPRTSPRNRLNHQVHRHKAANYYRSCDSFSRTQQRSLCFQLQRIHKIQPNFLPSSFPQPIPPPPPSELNEIDPRYGVEKRLVPSGPNPLHN
ncbi:hypothetical protein QUC31_013622 [Theobroma cacao]|nr:PREDICTED: CLAVATA3/ESR (CLE)-related protein 10 [Theobroma cacao]WRX14867.1 hypothetical protein QQP08_007354 [Theobroma cacao]